MFMKFSKPCGQFRSSVPETAKKKRKYLVWNLAKINQIFEITAALKQKELNFDEALGKQQPNNTCRVGGLSFSFWLYALAGPLYNPRLLAPALPTTKFGNVPNRCHISLVPGGDSVEY